MNEISCDVCLDLLPLVTDGIASDASRNAVLQHIAGCESCRMLSENGVTAAPELNEKRVLQSIKRRLALSALAMIVLGALLGVGLSDSSLVFYNVLLMPTVGALGYYGLREKAYLVPLVMLPSVCGWYLLKYFFSGNLAREGIGVLVSAPYWALIYAGLAALGSFIAFLLHFAFRKEPGTDARTS